MTIQCAKYRSTPRIPEFHQIILRTRSNHTRSRMPLNTLHIPPMPLQHLLLRLPRPIPHPHRRIIPTRNKLRIGRTKTQPMNRLLIVRRINLIHRRNTRRPILNIPPRITRQQIIIIMTPLHTPKRRIMRGHNQLKTKINPIPQGKLPLLIPRQQPSTTRRPTQTVHRITVLGTCDVCHVRAEYHGVIAAKQGANGQAHASYVT
mmetsp:Transcript_5317/g.7162  ORF Transcript_5317/g.7162 Transcript_5317/m.7162 type:complete len:204 (+) Transcript_5317:1552-2163(+)